jgi:hypothetical protein
MCLDQLPSFLPYVRSVFPSSDFSFNDYLSDLRILARPFRRAEYLPVSLEIFVSLSILESKSIHPCIYFDSRGCLNGTDDLAKKTSTVRK